MSSFCQLHGYTTREQKIKLIEDFLAGDIFPYYKEFAINDYAEEYKGSDDFWKKSFRTSNYMKKIVTEFLNYIPILKDFTTDKDKIILLLREFLEQVSWNNLQIEINKNQKTKADCFIYWTFKSKEDKFPILKVLKTENMKKVVRNEDREVIGFIYEDYVNYETLIAKTATTVVKSKLVRYVFERGFTTILDSLKPNKPKVILNPSGFENEFAIIQIPSYKEQDSDFSELPVEILIDGCLWLDDIETNIDMINKLAGFPQLLEIGVTCDKLQSERGVGAIIHFDYTDKNNLRGEVKQVEITNDLISYNKQRESVLKDVYKKSKLPLENLEEAMARSDSARVPQQIRLPLELEIERLLIHTIDGMEQIFKVILMQNKLYKKNEKIRFTLPRPIIKMNLLDELLIDAQKIGVGRTSVQKIQKTEENLTPTQQNDLNKQINEEIINGQNDISVGGLDNNFKKDTMNPIGVVPVQ